MIRVGADTLRQVLFGLRAPVGEKLIRVVVHTAGANERRGGVVAGQEIARLLEQLAILFTGALEKRLVLVFGKRLRLEHDAAQARESFGIHAGVSGGPSVAGESPR